MNGFITHFLTMILSKGLIYLDSLGQTLYSILVLCRRTYLNKKILLALFLFKNRGAINMVVTNFYIPRVYLARLRHKTIIICSVCLTPLLKVIYEKSNKTNNRKTGPIQAINSHNAKKVFLDMSTSTPSKHFFPLTQLLHFLFISPHTTYRNIYAQSKRKKNGLGWFYGMYSQSNHRFMLEFVSRIKQAAIPATESSATCKKHARKGQICEQSGIEIFQVPEVQNHVLKHTELWCDSLNIFLHKEMHRKNVLNQL